MFKIFLKMRTSSAVSAAAIPKRNEVINMSQALDKKKTDSPTEIEPITVHRWDALISDLSTLHIVFTTVSDTFMYKN